jgi:hypothetical protein
MWTAAIRSWGCNRIDMKSREPLNLQGGTNLQPVPKCVALILTSAVQDNADIVILDLDVELHKKVEPDWERLMREGRFENAEKLPHAFRIRFMMGEKKQELPPAPGSLFEPAVRILLNFAEIPYWKKKDISGELETINPYSKWAVESQDLAQKVQLRRIRAT